MLPHNLLTEMMQLTKCIIDDRLEVKKNNESVMIRNGNEKIRFLKFYNNLGLKSIQIDFLPFDVICCTIYLDSDDLFDKSSTLKKGKNITILEHSFSIDKCGIEGLVLENELHIPSANFEDYESTLFQMSTTNDYIPDFGDLIFNYTSMNEIIEGTTFNYIAWTVYKDDKNPTKIKHLQEHIDAITDLYQS